MSDDDDAIVRLIVNEVETAFSGHSAHDHVSVWVKDESGLSHAIEFSTKTATDFLNALREAIESANRQPHSH